MISKEKPEKLRTIGKVVNLFSERLKLKVPSPDTDLFDSGVLSSQVFAELLFHLEQEFNVKVSLEDLEPSNFHSVEAIAAFILGDGTPPDPVPTPQLSAHPAAAPSTTH